jgi:hypothetical protein
MLEQLLSNRLGNQEDDVYGCNFMDILVYKVVRRPRNSATDPWYTCVHRHNPPLLHVLGALLGAAEHRKLRKPPSMIWL